MRNWKLSHKFLIAICAICSLAIISAIKPRALFSDREVFWADLEDDQRPLAATQSTLRTTTWASGTDLNWRGKVVMPELEATLHTFGMTVLENATRVEGPYSTVLHQSLEFQGFLEDFAVSESRRARTLEERFPVGDGTLNHMKPEYIEAVTSSSWWQLKEGSCTVRLANGRVSRGFLRLKYLPQTFNRPYQRYNTQVLTFECIVHVRQYLCNETSSIRLDEIKLDWPDARERAVFTDVQVPCVTVKKPDQTNNTVAMCLPPLSKDFPFRRLVEFTAYHSSLGVKSFHFFSRYAKTSECIRRIFEQAPQLGSYTITESSFSDHGVPELFERYWYYEHLLWLNFCSRNMAKDATWVANLEMDEYLVDPGSSARARSIGSWYGELAGSTGKDIFVLRGPHVACDGSERFLTQCAYLRNLTGRPEPQPLRPKSVFRPQSFEYVEFHVVHPESKRYTISETPALIHYLDGSLQRSTREGLANSKERVHTLTSYTLHHNVVDSINAP